MRVGVAGGSGFIGSHIVHELCRLGHMCTIYDIKSPDSILTKYARQIDFVELDIMDKESVLKNIKDEIVFHLAGPVMGGFKSDPDGCIRTTIDGTLNVIQACKKNNVQKLLFPTTIYVYEGQPICAVSEKTQPLPYSIGLFGMSKLACENFIVKSGIPFSILRFGSTYGHGKSSNAVNAFYEEAKSKKDLVVWGDGVRPNQFTHVGDIAKYSAVAISAPPGFYNLVSPEVTTTAELAKKIAGIFGVNVIFDKSKQEGMFFPYVRSDNAVRELRWNPISLEEGLKSLG